MNRDGAGAAVSLGEGGGGCEAGGWLGDQLPVVPEVEQQGVGGEEAALPARPLTLKVLILRNQLNRKYGQIPQRTILAKIFGKK
jgi:hypothetical protein